MAIADHIKKPSALGVVIPPRTDEPQQIELEGAIAATGPKATTRRAKPEPAATGREPGKRSNPDYERLTTYVPKELKKQVARKWEDATGGKQDVSDLVEQLLTKYLHT